MHAHQISFQPQITFQLTEVELQVLRTMSVQHYDTHCRSQSKQGGLIFMFLNMCYDGDPHSLESVFQDTVLLGPQRWRDIDTLAKICEGAHFLPEEHRATGYDLGFFFSAMLTAMNDSVPDELHASTFLPKYAPPAEEPGPMPKTHYTEALKNGIRP